MTKAKTTPEQDKPAAPTLLPFQEKIVAERDRATVKAAKLDAFIASEAFAELKEDERTLLARQQDITHQMVSVLNARIAIFELPA